MQKLASVIINQFNPETRTFTRVVSDQLHALSEATRGELEATWDTIEDELTAANLFMYPALLDAYPGEVIRIYRKDSPLGKVVFAALFPDAEESPDILRAIKLLQEPVVPQPRKHRGNAKFFRPRPKSEGPTHYEQARHRAQEPVPDATEKPSAKHFARPLS